MNVQTGKLGKILISASRKFYSRGFDMWFPGFNAYCYMCVEYKGSFATIPLAVQGLEDHHRVRH